MRFYALLIILLSLGFSSCQTDNPKQNESPGDTPTATEEPAPQATVLASAQPTGETPEGMVWIPGGEFIMGSDHETATEVEGPAYPVEVSGFWMDTHEVTNAEFRKFVEETGYITVAERPIDWEEMKKQLPPGTPRPPDEVLQPGSLIFDPPNHAVPLHDYSQWWSWKIGANWQQPKGLSSSIEGKDDFPVTHIAYEDAQAYAQWADKRLPTEAEYEFAAQGGTTGQPFAWGDELTPSGKYLANFFQGDFPHNNVSIDGFAGASPVKSYPPNAYGLYDIIGNVWEWSSDWYRPDTHEQQSKITVCRNPTGPEQSYDPQEPLTPKRVIKGGSYLCSDQYCSNYRPSARMATDVDSGQEHLGFRCVKDAG
ncbi:MAG: formylglycine-generating enzyme family protein [Bacteroidota bacterium]